MVSRVPVERVLGENEHEALTMSEIDAIAELGFLTIACDRDLRDEELEGLGHILQKLHGERPAFSPLTEAIERYSAQLERDGIDGRLDICAAALSRKAVRDLAYKVSCALAVVDREIADREFELDLSIIAALGLTQDEADALLHEVHAVLQPPST